VFIIFESGRGSDDAAKDGGLGITITIKQYGQRPDS